MTVALPVAPLLQADPAGVRGIAIFEPAHFDDDVLHRGLHNHQSLTGQVALRVLSVRLRDLCRDVILEVLRGVRRKLTRDAEIE